MYNISGLNIGGRTLNYETVQDQSLPGKIRRGDEINTISKESLRRRCQQNGQYSQVSYFTNYMQWNIIDWICTSGLVGLVSTFRFEI